MIRVAAIADLHVGSDCAEAHVPVQELRRVSDDADVLLLAGDLTKCGAVEEAACLARTLATIEVPVLAVLGNHDYHADQAGAVAAVLRAAGVHLLEDGCRVVEIGGARVGVAGTKGFGGGFIEPAPATSASPR